MDVAMAILKDTAIVTSTVCQQGSITVSASTIMTMQSGAQLIHALIK